MCNHTQDAGDAQRRSDRVVRYQIDAIWAGPIGPGGT